MCRMRFSDGLGGGTVTVRQSAAAGCQYLTEKWAWTAETVYVYFNGLRDLTDEMVFIHDDFCIRK